MRSPHFGMLPESQLAPDPATALEMCSNAEYSSHLHTTYRKSDCRAYGSQGQSLGVEVHLRLVCGQPSQVADGRCSASASTHWLSPRCMVVPAANSLEAN